MKVLVACEYSGTVRDAFTALGHDATSCDFLPAETPGKHYQGDVMDILNDGWDLMIAFPPCTHLAVSGAKHFHKKETLQAEALNFIRLLLNAHIKKIALENPVGVISTRIRKPDQIIQPWMFGDPFTKTTCLWLKGLPLLKATKVVDRGKRHITKGGKSLPDWYNLPPGPNRAKIRSTTFPGIAKAMASQWINIKEPLLLF